jgi:hypothetical protein
MKNSKIKYSVARRFKNASNNTYYHGTSSEFLNDILQNGLKAKSPEKRWTPEKAKGTGRGPIPATHDAVYLTSKARQARSFAEDAAMKFGGRPLVVVVEVNDRGEVSVDNDYINAEVKGLMRNDSWILSQLEVPVPQDVDNVHSFALGFLNSTNGRDAKVYGRLLIDEVHKALEMSGDLDINPYEGSGELAEKLLKCALAFYHDPQRDKLDFQKGVLAEMGYNDEDVRRMSDRDRRNIKSLVQQYHNEYPLNVSDLQTEFQSLVYKVSRHLKGQRMTGEDVIMIPKDIDKSGSNKITHVIELEGVTDGFDEEINITFHRGSVDQQILEGMGIPTDGDSPIDVNIQEE